MKKIKIGLAGLGIVGKGVYDILKKDADLISKRAGACLEITAVSARSKKDFIDSDVKFYENSLDLASDPEIDIIVEVIGGDTLAKELCESALKNGKHYVTANKALLAVHGFELAKLAESSNVQIEISYILSDENQEKNQKLDLIKGLSNVIISYHTTKTPNSLIAIQGEKLSRTDLIILGMKSYKGFLKAWIDQVSNCSVLIVQKHSIEQIQV